MDTIPCHQVDSTIFQNQNQVAIQMNQLKEIMTARRFWALRSIGPISLKGQNIPFRSKVPQKCGILISLDS